MKHLLIVYHTRTGGALQMARAAAAGAASVSTVATRLLAAPEAGPGELLAAYGRPLSCSRTG